MSTVELDRFQRWFAEALVRDGPGGPGVASSRLEAIVERGPLSAAERMRVYQTAFWIRMHENLEEDYPELRRLLGADAFRHVARAFVTQSPEGHPSLIRLGEGLPAYLARACPERPALAEVARVEWAKIEVKHAEAPVAALSAPPTLPPEALFGLRLVPSPLTRALELQHRVGTWMSLAPELRGASPVEPGPQLVMVVRRSFVVHVEPISAPFDRVLARLHAGVSLGEAVAELDPASVEPAAVTDAFTDFLARGYFERIEL